MASTKIAWKRIDKSGVKPSKCGIYEIRGGDVSRSLWVNGWRVFMCSYVWEAREAAETLANGGRIGAAPVVFNHAGRSMWDTEVEPRGYVSLADIMALDADSAAA